MSLEVYDANGQLKTVEAGAAPSSAQYVTLSTNTTLSDERVLTAGSGISVTDAGAGSTVTVAIDVSPLTSITVDRANDVLPIEDVTDGSIKKITPDSLVPVTTKGDLLGFSTVPARVAVGTNGQYLKADSAQATGLTWDTPSGTSPTTTKGDLIVNDGGGAASDDRLPVGTNGQVLTADSGEATGLKWADAASGGGGDITLIDEQSGAGSSYSFTSIPGTYKHLLLVYSCRSDDANPAVSILVRANSDTGSNYITSSLVNANTTVSGVSNTSASALDIGILTGAGASDSNSVGSGSALFQDYAGTSRFKGCVGHTMCAGGGGGGPYTGTYSGQWKSTSAITQLDVYPSSGSFVSGSTVSLYGVN